MEPSRVSLQTFFHCYPNKKYFIRHDSLQTQIYAHIYAYTIKEKKCENLYLCDALILMFYFICRMLVQDN